MMHCCLYARTDACFRGVFFQTGNSRVRVTVRSLYEIRLVSKKLESLAYPSIKTA